MSLKSNAASACSKIIGSINHRRDQVAVLRKAIEEDKVLSDGDKEKLKEPLTSLQAKFEAVQKVAQTTMGAFKETADDEDEFKAADDEIKAALVSLTSLKKPKACQEAEDFATAQKEVKDRHAAMLKLAQQLQANASAQSAQALRGSAPPIAREQKIIGLLRHHVLQSGPPADFESVNCNHTMSSYFSLPPNVLCSAVRTGQLFKDQICEPWMKAEYYLAHSKWVTEYVTKHGLMQIHSDIVSPKAVQAMKKMLAANVDTRLMGKADGVSRLQDIFNVQMYLMTREHSGVALTAFCLPEVRIGFKGVLIMSGVLLSELEGDTLKKKIENVGTMNINEYMKVVKKNGFAFSLSPGQACVVPPGFVVLSFVEGAEAAEGARWSFLSAPKMQKERDLVQVTLEALLADHPVAEDDVMNKLHDHLTSD